MATQVADGPAGTLSGSDLVRVVQSDRSGQASLSAIAELAQTLTSPDGTQFRLTVADNGDLTAEEIEE